MLSSSYRSVKVAVGCRLPLISAIVLIGCSPPNPALQHDSTPAEASPTPTATSSVTGSAGVPALTEFDQSGRRISDWWYRIEIDGRREGSRNLTRTVLDRPDGQWTRWQERIELQTVRFETRAEQQLESYCIFDPADAIRAVGYRLRQGGQEQSGEGDVQRDGTLALSLRDGSEVRTRRIPWSNANQGYYAVEVALSKHTWKAGETRQVLGAQVVDQKLVQYQLQAAPEATSNSPLRIIAQVNPQAAKDRHLDGSAAPAVIEYHINSEAEIETINWPELKQVYQLTDQATAQRVDDSPSRDWGRDVRILLAPPYPDLTRLRRVTYGVRAHDKETLGLFDTGMGQSVIPHGDGQIRITVARESNETTQVETSDRVPPTSGDLASTALINCRHAKIVQVAQQWDTQRNPLLLAQEIERYVHETLQMSSFSAVFASAADALESRQGDCSEHAVLLAALCRAKKIPARVVIGLVFVPEEGAFFYHMWNDVWIGDRWWSLDATNGQGSVGVDHLRMQVGNLAEGSVFELVGKIVPTLNQLQIQVVEQPAD